MKKPDYRLLVDGEDISPAVNGRLISLSITDNRGVEADLLSLSLSDHDGQLDIPPTGAKVEVWIGWQDEPLIDKGAFIIDEVDHSGSPDVLNISGTSVDMREGLPGQKSRSWHDTTVAEILATIAGEHGLEPAPAPELAGIRIRHLDQTDESDLNLLTRLAIRHDAIATVKSGKLLYIHRGQASTLSGQPLPEKVLVREDADQHTYRKADRETYTGVKAQWNNVSGGKLEKVLAGSGEKVHELKTTFADEESALIAAEAELARLKRGEAFLTLTLSQGEPELIPETPLAMVGWKQQIDDTEWVATRISHRLNESGLMTSVEAEIYH